MVLVSVLAGAVLGAASLAFQCDDAFINFRYARNLHDGLGLVWNASPFRPVEGYGALLWILLLCAAWSSLGVEPPDAANVLSILCGVGQLIVVAMVATRLRRRDGMPAPPALGVLTVAVVASNRTFLQWMTSGMETALFNLTFLGWVVLACRAPERRTTAWLAGWSALAAASALNRPDGLLPTIATALVAAVATTTGERSLRRTIAGLLPLAAVAAHVAWRRSFYGEWLPNTYYAKVVGAWPEAGVRYFACFAVEHGTWLWLPIAVAWLIGRCVRAGRGVVALGMQYLPGVAAVATTVAHAGYYVLVVGGDHFEYRVLSQLVPLGTLGAAAILAWAARGAVVPATMLVSIGLASGVGWIHLALTADMPPHGFRPIAASVPTIVRPFAEWFDRQQAWLRWRNIGLRCNHHRMLLRRFGERFPEGMPLDGSPDPFPIYSVGAVGLAGWRLPTVAILDHYGLNDWVIARTPTPPAAPMPRETLRPLLAAADTDGDGFLDVAELRRAVAALGNTPDQQEYADYVANVLVTIYADERPGALSLAAAEDLGDALAGVRSMAHDRVPPPGYVEAFEPNVVVANGRARAMPRQEPMTAARIRAIEDEWRAKVEAQRRAGS